jgi:hypothetical protein
MARWISPETVAVIIAFELVSGVLTNCTSVNPSAFNISSAMY